MEPRRKRYLQNKRIKKTEPVLGENAMTREFPPTLGTASRAARMIIAYPIPGFSFAIQLVPVDIASFGAKFDDEDPPGPLRSRSPAEEEEDVPGETREILSRPLAPARTVVN